MKRSIIIAFCLVLCASTSFAQLGSIDVFSNPGYSDCNFIDVGGLITVYVLVTHSIEGTTAAQWRMELPSAWIMLGQTSPFQTVIGDALTGVSIAYGQCLTGYFLILTVNFFGNNGSPPCSYISIVPDPSAPSGNIEIVDCQSPPVKQEFSRLGQGLVNRDGTCNCTIPVQETTWGQVKALYQ
jgi:hypothetical protein